MSEEIQAPPWLKERGREEFVRIVSELKETQVLTALDITTLGLYCQLYDQLRDINQKLEEQGLILENYRENPLLKVQARTLSQLQRFMTQFGLSPRSRSMLKSSEQDAGDALDAFID